MPFTSNVSRRRFLQTAMSGAAYAGLAPFTGAFANTALEAGESVRNAMADGRPSTTAHGAAVLRAAHQILDTPRVLNDPLALRIISTASWTQLLSVPERFKGSAALRASVALRSRYAEDQLAAAVKRGIRQYVVLGAGLDTFAYRNPHEPSALRVFEVDHPATQSWKRQRLAEAGIAIPGSMTFAPVDFESQTLAEGLSRAGFDPGKPAYFSLLGVVIYLSVPAVMGTLAFIQSLPAGSEIVFDYSVPSGQLSDAQQQSRARVAQRVAERGEPWITYFDPPVLQQNIQQLGFSHVHDLGPQEANERYFRAREDNLRLSNSRLMLARV